MSAKNAKTLNGVLPRRKTLPRPAAFSHVSLPLIVRRDQGEVIYCRFHYLRWNGNWKSSFKCSYSNPVYAAMTLLLFYVGPRSVSRTSNPLFLSREIPQWSELRPPTNSVISTIKRACPSAPSLSTLSIYYATDSSRINEATFLPREGSRSSNHFFPYHAKLTEFWQEIQMV